MVVDSRYTEGVWYDSHCGDFCRIEQQRRGAALTTVDGTDTFHEWDSNPEASRELEEFVQVEDSAVENPVEYYRETVEELLDISQYGGGELSFSREISFRYADRQVEIQEVSE